MYLGIDLGTSNSVVAGIVNGAARVFPAPDGGDSLPSIIFFDKRGNRIYGRNAHDQAMLTPDAVAIGFKRLMGSSTPIQITAANVTLTPEECSADIIKQLLAQVASATGGAPNDGCIITIPAAFNQMQCEATMRAAKLAGLEKVSLLQEPVAAAMTAMGSRASKSGQFLIYDLGGGTFDLALAQAVKGEIKIVAHQGINMLGGRDFDRMLVNEVVRPWLQDQYDLPDNYQKDPEYRKIIRIAYLAAEKAKIELSTAEAAKILVPEDNIGLTDKSGKDIYLEVPVARKQYEDIIRSAIMQTVLVTRKILEENNYKNEDIDRIVFIGGPSRTPLIREMVTGELGIATDLMIDPMTAVATGAAYYAESMEWSADGKATPKATNASVNISTQQPILQETKPAAAPPQSQPPSEPPPSPQATASSDPVAMVQPEAKSPDKAQTAAPGLRYDYPLRSGLDEVEVKIVVVGDKGEAAVVMIESEQGWASEFTDITDTTVIYLPIRMMGDNKFTIKLFDSKDRHLDTLDHSFAITRTVATTASVSATQTIAVKALEQLAAQKNVLHAILEKNTTLPTDGSTTFKAARQVMAGSNDQLSLELFQVEYPERIELNLCIGVFRVSGQDLPAGCDLNPGDPITFRWRMSSSGILQASVSIAATQGHGVIDLHTPRFYAPQAGQVSFDKTLGVKFAEALLKQAESEWGDLAGALGPDGERDVELLKLRLTEQHDILSEDADDAETLRRVCEETRFIRQDIARMGRKHQRATLQRQLGKLTAIHNRMGRHHANAEENQRFDALAAHVQAIINDGEDIAFVDAEQQLNDMRSVFFACAWRDAAYVGMWFERLKDEAYLFPDQEEYHDLLKRGEKIMANGDAAGLRGLVSRMLESRIALTANDSSTELATIVRG